MEKISQYPYTVTRSSSIPNTPKKFKTPHRPLAYDYSLLIITPTSHVRELLGEKWKYMGDPFIVIISLLIHTTKKRKKKNFLTVVHRKLESRIEITVQKSYISSKTKQKTENFNWKPIIQHEATHCLNSLQKRDLTQH